MLQRGRKSRPRKCNHMKEKVDKENVTTCKKNVDNINVTASVKG